MFTQRRQQTGTALPQDTPYMKAAQVWDARIGDAYAHARNWRIMAFAMAGISLIFAGGFVYEATRTKIAAYYVPISEIRPAAQPSLISCRTGYAPPSPNP
jgi:type IV secretory pathway TrbF-like protein